MRSSSLFVFSGFELLTTTPLKRGVKRNGFEVHSGSVSCHVPSDRNNPLIYVSGDEASRADGVPYVVVYKTLG